MDTHSTGSADRNRDVKIDIRVKQSQRDLIDRAAAVQGRSCADFMLETARGEASAVLLSRRFFALDTEKFNQFMAVLDTLPASNEKLRTLLTTKSPWD